MTIQDENVDVYYGHHGSAYFDEHGPDEDRHHCRGCYVDDVACTGCEHYPPHGHDDRITERSPDDRQSMGIQAHCETE